MGASIAMANAVLVPRMASVLDIEAAARTLAIIDAARRRRARAPSKLLAEFEPEVLL